MSSNSESERLAKEAFGLTPEETETTTSIVNASFKAPLVPVLHMTPAQVRSLSEHEVTETLLTVFADVTKKCTGKALPFAMFLLGARFHMLISHGLNHETKRIEKTTTVVFLRGDKPPTPDELAALKERLGLSEGGVF